MGGGSSGGGGGAVVQTTAPWAANLAGQYGATAAMIASQQSTKAIQDAITQMNNQYITATKNLQPYTQEGVQSLDKLNSYLQLNPYNPGKAPEAPVNPEMAIDYSTGSIPGNKDWSALASMAQSILSSGRINQGGTTVAGSGGSPLNAHDITMAATQLMGSDKMTAGDLYFLNKFAEFGGAPGMTGTEFIQAFQDPAIQKYKDDMKQYDLNKENYDYAKGLYDQYTASGPMTSDQIYNDITNQPGYQAQLNQGIDAIQKAGSAKGYLGSGRLLKELNSYGQNTLSQFYGDTLSRLASLAGSGQQAATSLAGLNANQGNALASLYSSLGENKANATLAGANSLAQALIAGNQQFQVVGGGGGGGGGGIGQALGAIGSIASAFCSKDLKENFEPVSKMEILDKVNSLDIEKWNYKDIPVTHLGPYAGQFKELFGIGDGQSINLIDCIGICLASIQALSKKLNEVNHGH